MAGAGPTGFRADHVTEMPSPDTSDACWESLSSVEHQVVSLSQGLPVHARANGETMSLARSVVEAEASKEAGRSHCGRGLGHLLQFSHMEFVRKAHKDLVQ